MTAETREVVTFIGDVHGEYAAYKRLLKASQHPTVQVGDMGVGFLTIDRDCVRSLANPPYDVMVAGKHRFIRGNHDNPRVCERHTQYVPDGSTEKIGSSQVMFVGGAYSIDREYRIEGLSWWADEEVSYTKLCEIIDAYAATKPDVMVTHDAPNDVVGLLFGITEKTKTRNALQAMWMTHRPRTWIFGHWHRAVDTVIYDCRFICLNELQTVDVEL